MCRESGPKRQRDPRVRRWPLRPHSPDPGVRDLGEPADALRRRRDEGQVAETEEGRPPVEPLRVVAGRENHRVLERQSRPREELVRLRGRDPRHLQARQGVSGYYRQEGRSEGAGDLRAGQAGQGGGASETAGGRETRRAHQDDEVRRGNSEHDKSDLYMYNCTLL